MHLFRNFDHNIHRSDEILQHFNVIKLEIHLQRTEGKQKRASEYKKSIAQAKQNCVMLSAMLSILC